MKYVRFCAAVSAVAMILVLAGCAMLVSMGPASSSSNAKTLTKGETGQVTGRLDKDKNQYLLTDSRTGVLYRFVGLGKDGEKQLDPHVGKTVTVRLKVISTESAKAVNAQLVDVVS